MEKKIEEVTAYFNSLVPADRYKQTVRSSLADIDETEYQLLYEIVADNPFYTRKAELLRQVLEHYQNRKSYNSPLPLLFRQAVYLLAYELCNGDSYDTAQKKALDDVGLSHNMFSKWKMNPKKDFIYLRQKSAEAPTIIPLTYQGKKCTALIYLVSELSKQIKYNKFVDVFGGSSAVTVGISKKENAQYFINDIAPSMVAIYETLRNHGNLLLETFTEIQDAIQRIPEAEDFSNMTLSLFPDANVYELIEKQRNYINSVIDENNKCFLAADKKLRDFLYNYQKTHPDTVLPQNIYDDLSKYILDYKVCLLQQDALGPLYQMSNLKADLSHLKILYIRELYKYFKNVNKHPDCYSIQQRGIAAIFCLSHNFSARARSDLTNTINLKSVENFFDNKKVWEQVIHEYQHYKIKIFSQLDVDIVSNKDINCHDTLLYLDSPYIATNGYGEANKEKKKRSAQKKGGYGRKEFKALHDKLATFTGYWIFSCRVGIPLDNSLDKIPTDSDASLHKCEDLQFLFTLYSDIAKYVAFIRNNDESDEEYLTRIDKREVMFLNFPAIAPDINILRKLTGGSIDGCNKKSVYRIISYEKFYPLAIKATSKC